MTSTPEWVLAQIEKHADEVRGAPMGSGRSTLNAAAFALGRYVPHLVDRGTVEARLLRVALVEWGRPMDRRRAEATVRSGVDGGMREPFYPREGKSSATTSSATPKPPSPRVAPPPSPPKTPPDPQTVAELWGRCTSVLDDEEVRAWLLSRGIDPVRVEDDNLARALPADLATPKLPRWAALWDHEAKRRIRWTRTGHRLVLPLVDVEGNLRSVLARYVSAQPVAGGRKSLAPMGHTRRGFFLRDPSARAVLNFVADLPRSSLDPAERWYDDATERRIVIVEGEKKYLLRATSGSDATQGAATIGIVSGSWTEELGALIPDGWTVDVAVDPDGRPEGRGAGGGALYATKIIRSLEPRWRAGKLRIGLRPGLDIGQGKGGLVVRVAAAAAVEERAA